MLNLQKNALPESYCRVEDAVLDDETIKGLSHGAPEELTQHFRDCLRGILKSRKPNSIKDNLPRLIRLGIAPWAP